MAVISSPDSITDKTSVARGKAYTRLGADPSVSYPDTSNVQLTNGLYDEEVYTDSYTYADITLGFDSYNTNKPSYSVDLGSATYTIEEMRVWTSRWDGPGIGSQTIEFFTGDSAGTYTSRGQATGPSTQPIRNTTLSVTFSPVSNVRYLKWTCTNKSIQWCTWAEMEAFAPIVVRSISVGGTKTVSMNPRNTVLVK